MGGMSTVWTGDPAQCEAIGDQQLTDIKPHPRTGDTHKGPHVELSNAGLAFYNSIERVIVLTKIHRVSCIENPTTEEEIRHNDRANQFMQVLRKVRDLELTEEDYFWLTELKESKASLEKRFSSQTLLFSWTFGARRKKTQKTTASTTTETSCAN